MAAERFRHRILILLPITALRSNSDGDDAIPDSRHSDFSGLTAISYSSESLQTRILRAPISAGNTILKDAVSV
jgi:hypothetical protein